MISFSRLAKALASSIAMLALASCAHRGTAPQPPLTVMTSGGFAAALNTIAPRYRKASGVTLVPVYGASMGGASDSIPARLARGEPADILILARAGLDELAAKGLVDHASVTDLVRSQIGMAVKAGAPVPDISTRAGFLNTLLTAKSIGYSASASGRYLSTELFPQLEIYPRIRAKLVRIESERVAAVVARGGVEIGFQQVSEILPVRGIKFAGKIPAELQSITIFSTGIVSASSNKPEAQRLIDYLKSSRADAVIRGTGLDLIYSRLSKEGTVSLK